jgi:hypothetical protein
VELFPRGNRRGLVLDRVVVGTSRVARGQRLGRPYESSLPRVPHRSADVITHRCAAVSSNCGASALRPAPRGQFGRPAVR